MAKSAKARITGKASENKAALVSQMAASGITNPKEQAMFMAQMDHESGGFTKMEERFNYRSADRLMAVSGSARKLGKPAVEAAMAQGPEAVAEAMYGGRMGNTNPGDAYAFRGRGHVQLTGRDNYTAAGKALGLDLVNNPDLAAEPENAAKIASWYWKNNKLGDAAKQGDVLAVTKKINGGTNGLDDREKKYAKYLASASDGSLAQTAEGAQGKAPGSATVASNQKASDTTNKAANTKTLADDPTQGGRYSYKDIGNNQLSVTDRETGISELASEEQARAYRINEGKAYKDQLAQANDPNSYRPGGALSNSPASKASRLEPMDFDKSKPSYPVPVAPAVPVVASISAPPVSVAPTIPPIAEAPSVAIPMASADTKKPAAVSVSAHDAGQDLKDRRIAHIVTGGLSAT